MASTRGRKKQFFLYGIKGEMVRANVTPDKIDAVREEAGANGGGAKAFSEWLTSKGYKASIATPKIDKELA